MPRGSGRAIGLSLVSLLALSCASLLELDAYEDGSHAAGVGGDPGTGGVGGNPRGVGAGGEGGTGGIGGSDCASWEANGHTSRYHCEVLADAPVSYWRLGEATAESVMLDQGTSGQNGQRLGAVERAGSLIADDTDGAASFTGGRIDAGDIHNFAGRVSYTVECWVQRRSGGVYMALIDKIDSMPSIDTGWALSMRSTDDNLSWTRLVNDVANDNGRFLASPLDVNDPTYLVFTYDGSNLRGYVDGASAGAPMEHTLDIVASNTPLTIGAAGAAFGQFDGIIDEVAIYDYVLPVDRIAVHYSTGTR
jgi:hypothetical protein